jgi:hypothetical protein
MTDVQLQIKISQLLQNSCIIDDRLLRHKAESNVESNVQARLIVDYQQRRFVFVRFVNAIHNKHFVFLLQDTLRRFFTEE